MIFLLLIHLTSNLHDKLSWLFSKDSIVTGSSLFLWHSDRNEYLKSILKKNVFKSGSFRRAAIGYHLYSFHSHLNGDRSASHSSFYWSTFACSLWIFKVLRKLRWCDGLTDALSATKGRNEHCGLVQYILQIIFFQSHIGRRFINPRM